MKELLSTVEVFRRDIRMEFSIKKDGVIIMNRGKVKSIDRAQIPSGEKIKEIEDGYKYQGMLENDRLKEQEMKDKFRNEYFRRQN